MKMRLTSYLLGAALVALLSGFALSPNATLNAGEWVTYATAEYSIDRPPTWDLDTSGKMGMKFAILSPLASPEDPFRENINLVSEEVPMKDLTTAQYADAAIQGVKALITDAKIESNESMNDARGSYQRVRYTGKAGTFNLYFEQNYWLRNGKAYVVTFTCEQSQREEVAAMAGQILKTFKVK